MTKPLAAKTLPKVLLVSPVALDAQGSDLATFMRNLTAELVRLGYPFKHCVLTLNADGSSTYSDSDAVQTMHIQPALPFTDSFESRAINLAWSTRHALRPLLASFQPDVISVHDSRLYLPFHFMAQRGQPSVQVTLHNRSLGLAHAFDRTHAGLQHYWEQKLAAKHAQAVVLHSQSSLQMLQRDVLSQFDAAVCEPRVFPIGLNPAEYPARKKRLLNGKIVVSYIGSLNDPLQQFKRFAAVIAALPEACRKHMIEARVYSFDTMPEDIRQKQFSDIAFYKFNNDIENSNIDNNNVDVISALQQTEILLIPYTHDGLGILALQAMLTNCKIIATAGTAMDEYLEPSSYCGSDIGSDIGSNANSMTDQLKHVLDDIANIRQLQDQNHFRALVDRPSFNVEAMANAYIATWQDVLK